MDCREISSLLQEYVEKSLDSSVSDDVRKHIESCEKCSRDAEVYSMLFTVLDAYPTEPVPANLVTNIMTYIRQKEKRYSIIGITIPSWRISDFALVAASLLLCAAFSYQLILTYSDTAVHIMNNIWEVATSVRPDFQFTSVLGEIRGLQMDMTSLVAGIPENVPGIFQSFSGIADYVGVPIRTVLPFLAISAMLMFIGNLICLPTRTSLIKFASHKGTTK